jgi:uncharacterized protein YcfJ
MKTKRIIAILAMVTGLVGCEGYEMRNRDRGALAGTALGAGLGAIVGNQVGDPGAGVAIGAGFGALTGGLVGHAQDAAEDRSRDQDERLWRTEQELRRQRNQIHEIRRTSDEYYPPYRGQRRGEGYRKRDRWEDDRY